MTPYGVYDIGANTGFVSVGTDHDTAAFAVESLRRWWRARGPGPLPGRGAAAGQPADAGGVRRLPDPGVEGRASGAGRRDLAWTLPCCHFPPGTSKWNKIEHRLFCQITRTWRARPLTSHEVILKTPSPRRPPGPGSDGAGPCWSRGLLPRGGHGQRRAAARAGRPRSGPARLHGEWNYTVGWRFPGGPEPEPAPVPGRIPALTWPALAAVAGIGRPGPPCSLAVTVPFAAAREQRLHLDRGHGQKKPERLPLEAIVTAACCHVQLPCPTGC